MTSRSEITVRYAETDQMGVVYHGNYFPWFEIGRTTLLKDMGYSYKELEDENILLPVTEVTCQYKESAKYDDVVEIRTKVKEMKGVRITFSYELYRKADQQLLASGTTTHAFVNRAFKPINIKKQFPAFYQKLI
ncbi:acyl-CoA thioesterase [Alkaliphilus transvaalensis]|uniref:acyl-CoA thioesterase n=1 Tax=Alkaliphilus transvaalensis TaxID=114628 RepID=UPI000478BF78|nr:thioesterase family protein [Alkaliphilus transvaalensis]